MLSLNLRKKVGSSDSEELKRLNGGFKQNQKLVPKIRDND